MQGKGNDHFQKVLDSHCHVTKFTNASSMDHNGVGHDSRESPKDSNEKVLENRCGETQNCTGLIPCNYFHETKN